MQITITWWMLPTLITACSVGYAMFIYEDTPGWGRGIGNILMLIPALGISLVAWVVAAFFK